MSAMRTPLVAEPPRTRPRILVVIDDDEAAETLRTALTAGGYAVATVPDGAAALPLAEVYPPAAIVVCGDAHMPDGSPFIEGWERVMRAPATMISLSCAAPALALSLVRRALSES